MNNVLEFDYVDSKGKESHRVIWPVSSPSDKYFALDLTEFSEEERAFLADQLNDLHTVFLAEVKALGLGQNYRLFKQANMTNETKT